jgi:hypothetical protein
VTLRPSPPSLWTALTRTVRPTYGARRNAADGLRDVRHDRSERAQAMARFARGPLPEQDRRS